MAQGTQAIVRVAVIHGPNLNLLGVREPEVYGADTLADVESVVRAAGQSLGITLSCSQSNHEGELVDRIQALAGSADALILNAGAYTHTSIAIRDALLAVRIPFVEVHLSNVFARESMRHRSLMADLAVGVVSGLGADGYVAALHALHRRFGGH